eukprot:TRINITY_DN29206_c0_g1_i1.p1 TRINITY_DN29206_c0_g1~~TRINITY_DN29206_c0_g1_i1.p1  ORF type:complete len:338 (+),score=45.87 TRINITY_DN29206_c0_g1_i1:82-1095(+)
MPQPPESIQQLAKNLSLLSEKLLSGKNEDTAWREVMSQIDQLVAPQVTKALYMVDGFKRGDGGLRKPAGRSQAQHEFMSAVGLGSPRYQSPVQTRPVMSAPSLSSLPPPRTAISPRNSTFKALISPGPVASTPSYSRSLSGVVSPPPLPSSAGGLDSPRPPPPSRRPESPVPGRVPSPLPSQDLRSGSGYSAVSKSVAPLPSSFPAPVPITTPAAPCYEPPATPPQVGGDCPMPSQTMSSVRRSVDRQPPPPPPPPPPLRDSGKDQGGQTVGEVLAKAGLGEYAGDFISSGITTASQLYKQTGRDMQGMSLPTDVQTSILTLIRDYWIDLAAKHRIG